jgi:hypothetical protein
VAAEHALRYSLLLVPLFNSWAVIHFFVGARHLRKDLARLQAPQEVSAA